MRKILPQSVSSIYPSPYSTMSRLPSTMDVARSLILSTTVVISGWRRSSSATKSFLRGSIGCAATSTTMIWPLMCPVRTSTWRIRPLRVSSR